MIITTSWDDGHRLDMRVADMLDEYGLRGTFYIAKDFLPERMDESQLRELAKRHELGAHTLTHPTLTDIALDAARTEIAGSKVWLEDLIGQAVYSFCYPRGAQNPDLQAIVDAAGYEMARGVGGYHLAPSNRWNMETTLHIYPFPLRPLPDYPLWRGIRTRLQPLRNVLPHVTALNLPVTALTGWVSLAEALLEQAANRDQIWHLWGHSWEIDKFDMWDDLEAILKIAASYEAKSMTNSELAHHLWEIAP